MSKQSHDTEYQLKDWSHVENYFLDLPWISFAPDSFLLRKQIRWLNCGSVSMSFMQIPCCDFHHFQLHVPQEDLSFSPLCEASFLFESRQERWQSQVRLLQRWSAGPILLPEKRKTARCTPVKSLKLMRKSQQPANHTSYFIILFINVHHISTCISMSWICHPRHSMVHVFECHFPRGTSLLSRPGDPLKASDLCAKRLEMMGIFLKHNSMIYINHQ